MQQLSAQPAPRATPKRNPKRNPKQNPKRKPKRNPKQNKIPFTCRAEEALSYQAVKLLNAIGDNSVRVSSARRLERWETGCASEGCRRRS